MHFIESERNLPGGMEPVPRVGKKLAKIFSCHRGGLVLKEQFVREKIQ